MILQAHDPGALVAFGAQGSKTAGDLRRDVALVAGELPDASSGSEVALVFKHDRYALAVSLLAAWARGHGVCLPSNTQRESVWRVSSRDNTVTTLHDTDAGGGLQVVDKLKEADNGGAVSARMAEFCGGSLTLFTSGSTGEPQVIAKRSEQILGEASLLLQTFSELRGSRIVGTVPGGHIYGLLFTVLVPLLGGGSFLRETPLLASVYARKIRDFGGQVLVTVPAHLRSSMSLDSAALKDLKRVFCSTAPLLEVTAKSFVGRFGLPIYEVFGSTETGGIAWRDRAETEAWIPFLGVDVSANKDGRLVVKSPLLHDPEAPLVTNDLVSLRGNTFVHEGRSDGVVKVAGRRVSLPALEAAMKALPGVTDAGLVSVPDNSGRGVLVLAAVCGQSISSGLVRERLSEEFEPSTLPRRIEVVETLPRDATGKLSRSRLLRLFGRGPSGERLVWEMQWPQLGEVAQAGEGSVSLAAKCIVPEALGWFPEHFATYPILPAAVQLRDIVMALLRRHWHEPFEFKGFKQLKFIQRIEPGDTLDIDMSWQTGQHQVTFVITRQRSVCSSGQVIIAAGSKAS